MASASDDVKLREVRIGLRRRAARTQGSHLQGGAGTDGRSANEQCCVFSAARESAGSESLAESANEMKSDASAFAPGKSAQEPG